MAKGADCAENGPFFPTTPRNVIQNGIAIARDIVVMPDWVLIGAMLGSFALLMIILVIGLVSLVFFCSVPRNGFCVQTSFVMFSNCKVVGTKYLAYEVVFYADLNQYVVSEVYSAFHLYKKKIKHKKFLGAFSYSHF